MPEEEASARIAVRITTRGGRDAIEGWRNGALRIRVAAPALDGRANEALLRLLARALHLPRGRVGIAHGEHSQLKLITIHGLDQDQITATLGRIPDG
jgi:uncharacterized protein (TIGR00251 family)